MPLLVLNSLVQLYEVVRPMSNGFTNSPYQFLYSMHNQKVESPLPKLLAGITRIMDYD